MEEQENKQWYYSKRKPNICPRCGGRKVLKISYGEPTPWTCLQEHEGKLILGGCVIDSNGPVWQCLKCGAEICHERSRVHNEAWK